MLPMKLKLEMSVMVGSLNIFSPFSYYFNFLLLLERSKIVVKNGCRIHFQCDEDPLKKSSRMASTFSSVFFFCFEFLSYFNYY